MKECVSLDWSVRHVMELCLVCCQNPESSSGLDWIAYTQKWKSW